LLRRKHRVHYSYDYQDVDPEHRWGKRVVRSFSGVETSLIDMVEHYTVRGWVTEEETTARVLRRNAGVNN